MNKTRVSSWLLLACFGLAGGCLSKLSVIDGPDGGWWPIGQGHGGSASPDRPVGMPDVGPQDTSCTRGGYCSELDTERVDTLDLLLVMDDSSSMGAAQNEFVARLPAIVNLLGGADQTHRHVTPLNLHLGVVSTDLGVRGVDGVPSCSSAEESGGQLQSTPHGDGCDMAYPTFLSGDFDPQLGAPLTDPTKLGADFACIARLGTGGCGYTQPLEAALRALWPRELRNENGVLVSPNPVSFPGPGMALGDVPGSEGGNLGFIRNDRSAGGSVLGLIVVSDDDDCSISNPEPFAPDAAQSSSVARDLGLRCLYNQSALYDVAERYARALPLLKPGHPERFVFGAVVGVPADLVDSLARAHVDFQDAEARDRYYKAILDDPRMDSHPDWSTMPGSGTGQVSPSCLRVDRNQNFAVATPPRRIVELARKLGPNSVVESICQDALAPAMDPILRSMLNQLGETCLPVQLNREATGKVACDVVWELPQIARQGTGSPTECSQASFLHDADPKHKRVGDHGGRLCVVDQVAAQNGELQDGQGWYYDDFSDERLGVCRDSLEQRIGFTPEAKVPADVRVVLDCGFGVATRAANTKVLTGSNSGGAL